MIDLAGVLDARLEDYAHVPEVGALVRSALGVTGPVVLGDVLVSAFQLVPGDTMFAAYVLSEGALHVAETNDAGAQLIVVIPFQRIRRIVELHDDDGLRVTIEFDADVVRSVGEFETRTGQGGDDGVRPGIGRMIVTGSCATYDLVAVAEDPTQDELHEFAVAFRRRLAQW